MKVIFLDIDGVLNSTGFQENNSTQIVGRNNAALLRKLIDETGAVVVLSSGWKLWFDADMNPVTKESVYLYDMLCEYGISLLDKTPDYSTEEIRKEREFSKIKAKEIKAWLSAHNGVESYVVLEDMDLKDEDIMYRTVRINNAVGLSEEDVGRAVNMLLPEKNEIT